MIRARIADADAEIDATLAHRYTTPFCADPLDAPMLIKSISKTLAVCDVFDRAPTTPPWITTRCDWARQMLAKLADGELNLPGVEDISGAGIITTSTSDFVPVFGAAPSKDERIDPQRRLLEQSARNMIGLDPEDW